MAKVKQKKPSLQPSKKKKIVLLIIVLLIVSIGAMVVARVLEADKAAREQMDLLHKSLAATQVVYNRFNSEVTIPTQTSQPPSNGCTKVGAKYSTDYNCGTSAKLTIAEISEAQYIALNNQAVDIYKSSDQFERVVATPPHDNELDPGLSGSAGSRVKGTDFRCYYSSNFVPEKKSATFSWGCRLVADTQIFPLED